MALEDISAVGAEAADPIDPVDPINPQVVDPNAEAIDPVDPADPADPNAVVDPADAVDGDGRSIPAQYKELFKTDKSLRSMWFERAEFRKDFPEGPKQAKELLSIIADVGGREGIDGLKGELQEMKQVDELFAAGDPKAIEKFAQFSPEGFSKLAPEVMSKWYQIDPEGCNKTLCGVIANTFAGGNFDGQLERAGLYLEVGKPEEAIKILQGMQTWAKSFSEAANKPLTPKTTAPQVDQRVQELDQREARLFNEDLGRQIVSFRDPLIEKELQPFIPKGTTLDPDKRDLLIRESVSAAGRLLDADQAFQKKWASYVNGKDVQGAVKLSRSKLAEIMPDVVKKVARTILGSPASAPRPNPVAVAPTPIRQAAKPKDPWDEVFSRA